MSPTQRTLAWLRGFGYFPWIVERWNQYTKKRTDLYNIIDIIAVNGVQILGVQSCGQAFSEHLKKLTVEHAEHSRRWIESGGVLLLIGWRKVKKKRGGKQMVWEPRMKHIELEDLQDGKAA